MVLQVWNRLFFVLIDLDINNKDINMTYKILRTVFRENQYEIIYDIFDDNGKLIVGNQVYPIGKEETLSKEEEQKLFDDEIFPNISTEPIEQEKLYTEDEVTDILIEKKYLEEGEKFSEDMSENPDAGIGG